MRKAHIRTALGVLHVKREHTLQLLVPGTASRANFAMLRKLHRILAVQTVRSAKAAVRVSFRWKVHPLVNSVKPGNFRALAQPPALFASLARSRIRTPRRRVLTALKGRFQQSLVRQAVLYAHLVTVENFLLLLVPLIAASAGAVTLGSFSTIRMLAHPVCRALLEPLLR